MWKVDYFGRMRCRMVAWDAKDRLFTLLPFKQLPVIAAPYLTYFPASIDVTVMDWVGPKLEIWVREVEELRLRVCHRSGPSGWLTHHESVRRWTGPLPTHLNLNEINNNCWPASDTKFPHSCRSRCWVPMVGPGADVGCRARMLRKKSKNSVLTAYFEWRAAASGPKPLHLRSACG